MLVSFWGFAQNHEETLKDIRKNFMDIENNLKNLKTVEIVDDSMELHPGMKYTTTAYYDKNEIVRVEYNIEGLMDEEYHKDIQYNLKNGVLFFIFESEYISSAQGDEAFFSKSERRVYIDNGKIIEVLYKSADNDKIDLAKVKNKKDEVFLKDVVKKQKEYTDNLADCIKKMKN